MFATLSGLHFPACTSGAPPPERSSRQMDGQQRRQRRRLAAQNSRIRAEKWSISDANTGIIDDQRSYAGEKSCQTAAKRRPGPCECVLPSRADIGPVNGRRPCVCVGVCEWVNECVWVFVCWCTDTHARAPLAVVVVVTLSVRSIPRWSGPLQKQRAFVRICDADSRALGLAPGPGWRTRRKTARWSEIWPEPSTTTTNTTCSWRRT